MSRDLPWYRDREDAARCQWWANLRFNGFLFYESASHIFAIFDVDYLQIRQNVVLSFWRENTLH
jgi:hypothetical protein